MSGLICDTSGLLAFFDVAEDSNQAVSEVVDAEAGPFVVSPFVLAELHYLLATRRGTAVEMAVLGELAGGGWELAPFDITDLRNAMDVIGRYEDTQIGLADASLVVLAEKYKTDRILTLDRRHFDVVRTQANTPFDVVPVR
jgi:hypothetical protein